MMFDWRKAQRRVFWHGFFRPLDPPLWDKSEKAERRRYEIARDIYEREAARQGVVIRYAEFGEIGIGRKECCCDD